jgi:phosphoglycerate dehydrogenase-like enzyme
MSRQVTERSLSIIAMHELLILSRHADAYLRMIQAANLPGLSAVAASNPEEGEICGSDCDIVFGEPSLISMVLQQLPGLRWVQSTWAGVEPLLDSRLRRDYILTNARGVFGGLMSEYVFAYLLAHERRILHRHAAQTAGQWDNTPPGTLRGKKIGLMGVGSIGACLAGTAKHFGMTVKGYTRASETCTNVDAYYHGKGLMTFAADLDYLVSVLPNTANTRRIVDAVLLAALPPRAVFVNVGRGSAVDEVALAEALQAGRIAGAVLDVFQEEPLPPGHILWRTPNVWITSHTAAPSIPEDIVRVFLGNYDRFCAGAALRYRVDFKRGY